jgi:5-deoxy-glucuronate isomerase
VNNRNQSDVLFHSNPIPRAKSGILLSVTREQAGWETINFSVRRLLAGQSWSGNTGREEAVFVVLSGRLTVDWDSHPQPLGYRDSVFSGYPHAAYLPCHTAFEITAETTCEFADARVGSEAQLQPRVIRPRDIYCEIRGGGNATRQILDIIRPEFPADKLLVCEVYTPSGNWSSYPPHKHDVHAPPREVDLDEVYYYRIDHPEGYALQRLYGGSSGRDEALIARDGDLILIRDGYHPVVAAHGYNVYYLNVLAGSARSMAASDDPQYAHLRRNWPARDPRVPLVQPAHEEVSAGV